MNLLFILANRLEVYLFYRAKLEQEQGVNLSEAHVNNLGYPTESLIR